MPPDRLPVEVRVDPAAPPGGLVSALARLLRRLRDQSGYGGEVRRGGRALGAGERAGEDRRAGRPADQQGPPGTGPQKPK